MIRSPPSSTGCSLSWTTHPEAFYGISRDEFVAALDEYEQQLPDLDDDQAVVGLMRVVAMLSREGRDGHQFALPRPGHEGAVLPLRIYEFAEGVYVTDEATVYVRYRNVVRLDITDARELLGAAAVDRLILDLRQNPGGDNNAFGPLLSLVQDFAADHRGGLMVVTDRVTFSAVANLATRIEQSTDATFIGEAMGGGLNFWNDVRWIALDALPVPMRVGVSTRYWQFATADDPRLTIAPDVEVPVAAADFFGGIDPALDAAMTHER